MVFISRCFNFLILLFALVACQSEGNTQPQAKRTIPLSLDWLIKNDDLKSQVEINKAGIALYASEGARDSGLVECRIYPVEYELTRAMFRHVSPDTLLNWYEIKGRRPWPESFKRYLDLPEDTLPLDFASIMPLKGMRIAIDPGHVSADLASAEIEGKYVKMLPSKEMTGDSIAFFEPYLTLVTAWIIRDSLKKLGAEVLVTRKEPGIGVRGISYETWKKEKWPSIRDSVGREENWTDWEVNYWKKKAGDKEIFKTYFNSDDLRARAEMVNAFRPHLTMVIHYNIHSPNWDARDKDGFFKPTDANYSMAFIPGSFASGELESPEDRLALLRMLLTHDVMDSYLLSDAFIQQSIQHTKVPPVLKTMGLPYLDKYSILTTSPGVYARNLSLTRLIWGPIVYGESFCQDNREEALRLANFNKNYGGYPYPDRLDEVANAYIGSVWEYAKQKADK